MADITEVPTMRILQSFFDCQIEKWAQSSTFDATNLHSNQLENLHAPTIPSRCLQELAGKVLCVSQKPAVTDWVEMVMLVELLPGRKVSES